MLIAYLSSFPEASYSLGGASIFLCENDILKKIFKNLLTNIYIVV